MCFTQDTINYLTIFLVDSRFDLSNFPHLLSHPFPIDIDILVDIIDYVNPIITLSIFRFFFEISARYEGIDRST